MLIGKDDISNDVITLSTCFSMLVYSRDRFRFALIGGNLTAHSTGSYREIGGGIQISKTQLQALLPFPAPLPESPGKACSQATLWCGCCSLSFQSFLLSHLVIAPVSSTKKQPEFTLFKT